MTVEQIGNETTSTAPRGQLTKDDLDRMTPEEINQARRDGHLDWLLRKA